MTFKSLKQKHLLEEIFTCVMTLNYALEEQIILKDEFDKSNESTKQKNPKKKEKNTDI